MEKLVKNNLTNLQYVCVLVIVYDVALGSV